LRFVSDHTIYTRIGDLVAWISLVITAAAVLAVRRGRR
jgi:apolipoprotein N-acyltransferase